MLVFFIFLFAKAGCLSYVSLGDVITNSMLNFSGGENVAILIVIMLWFSEFASATMDNVLAVAALVPMVVSLTEQLGTPVL